MPGGSLAILSVNGRVATEAHELHEGVLDLIRRYTTYDEWRPDFDLVAHLERRGLFLPQDRAETEVMPFRQTADEYVESFHARASLSWHRMDRDEAAAFDAALREFVLQRVGDEVELAVRASIVWGKPVYLKRSMGQPRYSVGCEAG
jgi:hypothetical protein